jgi:glycerophosphoryl diester phosphodiesterase
MRPSLLSILFLINIQCTAQSNAVPLVIAHRGASAYKAENSLSAFEEAIRLQADYIETDVHQTSDGVVVIMHDLSVNRTCTVPKEIRKKYGSGKTLIRNMSYADFQALQLKGQEEHPPSLDSALQFIHGRCKLLIELKKGNGYYPEIEKHVIEIIAQNHAEAWVDIIHSFDKKALLNVREQKSGVKLQKLIVFRLPLSSFVFSRKLNRDYFKDWQGVNVYRLFAGRRLINRLHRQNISVFAWTVNKRRKARKLINKGIDGIITNRPDMVRQLVKKSSVG